MEFREKIKLINKKEEMKINEMQKELLLKDEKRKRNLEIRREKINKKNEELKKIKLKN